LSQVPLDNRSAILGLSLEALISAAEKGERAASEKLFVAMYSELHRLAKGNSPGKAVR
jgi:hypothetical protein